MESPIMRSDSRIGDVLHTLSDPEEYVRGILGSFIAENFSRDEAVIRIGISGNGKAPRCCIEQGFEDFTFTLGSFQRVIKAHAKRAVFHGESHNRILDDKWKGNSWSSAPMTFAELQAIL
jgi:hypothetical protein